MENGLSQLSLKVESCSSCHIWLQFLQGNFSIIIINKYIYICNISEILHDLLCFTDYSIWTNENTEKYKEKNMGLKATYILSSDRAFLYNDLFSVW